MHLKFIGAAKTVTGSCYFLDTGETKILVDCGLFQGPKELKEFNYEEFPFYPNQINHLLLTHAHIDHSGLIPKLIKKGFRGEILATSATADLASILLPDSGHIQEVEVERKNRKLSRAGKPLINPIYTEMDAYEAMKYFRTVGYDQEVRLTPKIKVRFREAGHILGSAMIELWVEEDRGTVKVVFSGDIGRVNQPIINNPSIIEDADYLIMESTYGNRLHDERFDRLELLRQAIIETLDRNGKVIIPAFAIERTQDLLYGLRLLQEKKQLPQVDIYIDSPLAISATEIFRRSTEYYDQETKDMIARGLSCFELHGLKYSRTVDESQALNQLKGKAIIIAGSGMCDAGRIKHHLKHQIWRQENSVIFVGYQAEGSLGRRILDGEKTVRIHGEQVAVRAQIHNIGNFSAHADKEDLINWVKEFRKPPSHIFLVHGEPDSALALKQALEELGLECSIPERLEEIRLVPVSEGKVIRLASGQERTVVPGAAISFSQVEEAYYQLRLSLRELVENEMDEGNYGELLKTLDSLHCQIKERITQK